MAARPVCFPARRFRQQSLVAMCLLGGSLGVSAQYKLVAPDGSVTYTDRPTSTATSPAPAGASRVAETGAGTAALPYVLRQVVARYPLTLYTAPDCGPCDTARALLRQRGVPLTERSVPTPADVSELRRIEQTTDLPILRLGAQRLVGFSADEWSAMLDAAGYPRQSVLPAGYRHSAAQALVAPGAAQPQATLVQPPALPNVPPPTPAGVGGIRF